MFGNMVKVNMGQEKENIIGADNLPNKSADLSTEGNLKAAQSKHDSLLGKKGKPKGCLVQRMINSRPYWYRIIKVKVRGKWKNKETYLGTRKPRE